MLKNRPIVVITLGYIIGIIVGLYCKISIVSFYAIIFLIYKSCKKPHIKQFKLFSVKRYLKYIKIIINKNTIIIFIVFSILSNTIVIYKNNEFKFIQQEYNNKEIYIHGKIISNVKTTKYKNIYKLKIYNRNKLNRKTVYLSMDRKSKTKIEYGYEVSCYGIYISPEIQRNYKGFNYSQYLKTINIFGTIDVLDVQVNNKSSNILTFLNNVFLDVNNNIKNNFEKNASSILIGMILGKTDEIEDEIKIEFSNSNISHLLAISGMHISCLILLCQGLKIVIGKRKTYIFTIIILISYIAIIGMHPSAIRAVIMASLALISKIFHKKSDIWTNISLSVLILLLYNPFFILNTGLILSYMGTIAIIIYAKYYKVKNKILNIFFISLAVYISILPIISVCFNQIPILSFFIGSIIGTIITPIIIIGFIYIIISYFKFNIVLKIVQFVLSYMTKILLKIVNLGANIIFNKTYITTPSVYEIFLYYMFLIIPLVLYKIYHVKNKTAFIKRLRSIISIFIYKTRLKMNKVISICIIFLLIILSIRLLPKDLKIYFIDVGQGDSCLITSPHNKKILIDGGGSSTDDYDVGKNILIPYLLDRKIKELDYIIISHFDADHAQGCAKVLEELKVSKIILAKQVEESELYRKVITIAKQKKTKLIYVKQGDILNIDGIKITVLYPKDELILENAMNNNSIVCKLEYNSFSMIFTGDIEEIAEKKILDEYKNDLKILNSTILKVAHHGSKTSSIEEFIRVVNPKIALIGVGKNNKFGHPNNDVIKRLENIRYKSI